MGGKLRSIAATIEAIVGSWRAASSTRIVSDPDEHTARAAPLAAQLLKQSVSPSHFGAAMAVTQLGFLSGSEHAPTHVPEHAPPPGGNVQLPVHDPVHVSPHEQPAEQSIALSPHLPKHAPSQIPEQVAGAISDPAHDPVQVASHVPTRDASGHRSCGSASSHEAAVLQRFSHFV